MIKALVSSAGGGFAQQEMLDFARHSLDVDFGLGDFDSDGIAELAFWNQRAKALMLANLILHEYDQTLADIAAEKNSTIVFPFPEEVLHRAVEQLNGKPIKEEPWIGVE